MNSEKLQMEFQARRENQALTGGEAEILKIVGDYTIVETDMLPRTYELQDEYAKIRNLEYRSDEKIKIQTYEEYQAEKGALMPADVPFNVETMPRPSYPKNEQYRDKRKWYLYPLGRVMVMVAKEIYGQVADSIDQYVLDVGRDGYWATIHVVEGGDSVKIRNYIKRRQRVGVLLVGAIAAPWFEMDNGSHSEFPCDLYYMDATGDWSDADGDGKFDDHTGDENPEIWVGRLYTPTAGGNDAALINDYFKRNHKFRLGELGHPYSGLAYVDDDWKGFAGCGLDLVFPPANVTVINDPNQTDADQYKAEVNSQRSIVQLCAHSWTQGHALWVPSDNANEYIRMPYFRDTNPPNAHFYNLFCCGPGRFTSADYLAGWYIFDKEGHGTNHGLAAIASAKSGSMLFFDDFYRPLGQGKVIGDAFVDWWLARGPHHDQGERSWYYGLVLLGDPTLNWWKGVVPTQVTPQNWDKFDHYPRRMQFRWEPVTLPGAKYTVEIDAFGAVSGGKWAEETNQTFFVKDGISETTLDFEFVGMQRGRWRVRAEISNQKCSWSPWSYFRFTI